MQSPTIDTSQSSQKADPAVEADSEALRQISRGNLAGFDAFVDRYKSQVFAHVRRRVTDVHKAEDLTQETFLRLFRAARAGAYNGRARVTTWLFTIASNCITDYLRSESRRPRQAGLESIDAIAPLAEDPVRRADADERTRLIRRAMQRLPDDQRQVIEMKLIDGLSFSEMGELLGCPVPTVKSRMAYGLRKLQSMLDEHREDQ